MGPEIGYKANTAGAFNNITGPYIDMWNKKGYAGWGNMCLFPVEEFHSMADGMVQLLLVVGAGLDYTC